MAAKLEIRLVELYPRLDSWRLLDQADSYDRVEFEVMDGRDRLGYMSGGTNPEALVVLLEKMMVFDSSRTRLSQWEEDIYLDLEVKGKGCRISSKRLPAFELDCHELYETVADFIDLFCEAMDRQVAAAAAGDPELQKEEAQRKRAFMDRWELIQQDCETWLSKGTVPELSQVYAADEGSYFTQMSLYQKRFKRAVLGRKVQTARVERKPPPTTSAAGTKKAKQSRGGLPPDIALEARPEPLMEAEPDAMERPVYTRTWLSYARDTELVHACIRLKLSPKGKPADLKKRLLEHLFGK